MVIFHSYVSLPEGRIIDHWIIGLQTCNNYPKKISLINGSTAHWVLTWCRLFFLSFFRFLGPDERPVLLCVVFGGAEESHDGEVLWVFF